MIRTPRILVADLHRHVGETVSIAGWAQTLRLQRALQFVIVRGHTGAVQVTHRRDGTLLEAQLDAQAAEKGLSPEPMRDYLNNFRYGCPPHGGFGLGLGRLLMTLLGLDSIRDATFLFRGPNRLTP
jgi:aspartyl/asparaginyl-tRNA synthetase